MILQYLLWTRSKTANGEEWGMRWQSMAGISLGSPPMVDCFAEVNNRPRSRNIYLRYSRLSITRTLANSNLACANSNQSWFLLDFLLTFAVILPSITWTLDNSNLPLTRSDFCFPSDHIYIILPSILEPCYKRVTSQEKKTVYWSPRHWIYFKATASILCLYFFVTPVQIRCPFLLLNYIPSPSILFSYFRLFASNSRQLERFSICLGSSRRVGKGVFREPWTPIFDCRESWTKEYISLDPWTKVIPRFVE